MELCGQLLWESVRVDYLVIAQNMAEPCASKAASCTARCQSEYSLREIPNIPSIIPQARVPTTVTAEKVTIVFKYSSSSKG